MKTKIQIPILIAFFLTTILSAKAQFGGGNGQSENPYLIHTVEQLAALSDSVATGNSYANQYFRLTTDLDLASWCADHASTGGWEPIGDGKWGATCFSGHFNGANHKIQNLTMNRTADYQGLFGCISGSIIDSLGITAINITATSVVNNSNSGVGGLTGKSDLATVRNCYVICTIKGDYNVGGLIGKHLRGTIQNCYSSVMLEGTGDCMGGLVGFSGDKDGIVQNCYVTGAVNGRNGIGGVMGANAGTIQKCYSTCIVNGTNDVGGLVGRNFDNWAKIKNCVAANSSINATDTNIHRIVGIRFRDSILTNCYALESMMINGSTVNCINPDSLHGADKSLAQLQQQNTYTAIDTSWNFTTTWNIWENRSFPYYLWQSAPVYNVSITSTAISFELRNNSDSVEVYKKNGDTWLKVHTTGTLAAGTRIISLGSLIAVNDMIRFLVYESQKWVSYTKPLSRYFLYICKKKR